MSVTHFPSAALHADPVEGNVSNSNSQDSSGSFLTATSTSELSQTRAVPLAVSQRVNPGPHDNQITPLSSYSNESSQEQVSSGEIGNASSSKVPNDEFSSTARDATKKVGRTEQTGGVKRTATGHIKSPSRGSPPPSPMDSNVEGHSRNSSMASRSSHIAEISSKLQARMSYAKVKVDHGWEGHSISELERMTSAQASPVSISSYTARNTTPSNYSPVEYSLHAQTPGEASTSVPRAYHHPAPQDHADVHNASNILNGLTTHGTAMMPNARTNETYEQFWQSHSNPVLSSTHKTDTQPLNGRSLAPPVDLYPRHTASTKQKLPLSTSTRFPRRLPSTPPTRHSALANSRTPVEQDALEGLLSMNSPANSQNQSTTRPFLQSPLHDQGTEPSLLLNGIVNGKSISASDPTQSANALGDLNDDELNKILDDMPDTSSDEDVEVKRQFPAEQLLRS